MLGRVLALAFFCSGSVASAETTHELRPVAAGGSTITDSKFSTWAQNGTRLLQNDDAPGIDFACDVSLTVTHPIIFDPNLPNLVQTRAEKQKLTSVTAGNVVILDDLRYCGRTYLTTVAGCEGSGPILLVTQNSAAFQTLVHEMGHRFGFGHTWNGSGCPAPPPADAHVSQADFLNIMFCRGHAKRLALTENQCEAFQDRDFPDLLALDAPAPPPEEVPVPAPVPATVENVGEFLAYGFDHGTPFEAIDTLTDQQLDEIRSILDNAEKKELWANAAIVLALRGGREDIERIIGLFREMMAAASPEEVRARTSAAYGIGIMAQRFPEAGDEGLSLLLENVTLASAFSNTGNDPEGFAKAAAFGIAYSGNVAATKAVIDTAAAAGRVSVTDNSVVADYVNARILDPEERADLPELPVLDSDFVQTLADTSVGVANQGLDYLRNPEPPTINSMNSLLELSLNQTIGPNSNRIISGFGLQNLPEWRELLPPP